jgi:hypothetical protein
MDGGGIDTDFIGTGVEHGADILQGPNAATDRERNKYLAGDLLNGVNCGVPFFVTGGDIEKGNLVSARLVIAAGNLYRVSSITDADEIHALDNTTLVNIEAGNNALGQWH